MNAKTIDEKATEALAQAIDMIFTPEPRRQTTCATDGCTNAEELRKCRDCDGDLFCDACLTQRLCDKCWKAREEEALGGAESFEDPDFAYDDLQTQD